MLAGDHPDILYANSSLVLPGSRGTGGRKEGEGGGGEGTGASVRSRALRATTPALAPPSDNGAARRGRVSGTPAARLAAASCSSLYSCACISGSPRPPTPAPAAAQRLEGAAVAAGTRRFDQLPVLRLRLSMWISRVVSRFTCALRRATI